MLKSHAEYFILKGKNEDMLCKTNIYNSTTSIIKLPHGNAHKQIQFFRNCCKLPIDYIDYLLMTGKVKRYY